MPGSGFRFRWDLETYARLNIVTPIHRFHLQRPEISAPGHFSGTSRIIAAGATFPPKSNYTFFNLAILCSVIAAFGLWRLQIGLRFFTIHSHYHYPSDRENYREGNDWHSWHLAPLPPFYRFQVIRTRQLCSARWNPSWMLVYCTLYHRVVIILLYKSILKICNGIDLR